MMVILDARGGIAHQVLDFLVLLARPVHVRDPDRVRGELVAGEEVGQAVPKNKNSPRMEAEQKLSKPISSTLSATLYCSHTWRSPVWRETSRSRSSLPRRSWA